MSDPAIEAAQRVIGRVDGEEFVAEAAAREALRPIRQLHRRTDMPHGAPYCLPCKTTFPCATAKLIYATEELS